MRRTSVFTVPVRSTSVANAIPTRRWKNVSVSFRCRQGWLVLVLLGVLSFLVAVAGDPACAAQADPSSPPAEKEKAEKPAPPKDWQLVLSVHQESLVQQATRFKALEDLLTKDVKQFRERLTTQQNKLDELELITSLSAGNPWELQAVLNDMLRIRGDTEALIAPFQNGRDELQKIATNLEALRDEFAKRLDDDTEQEIAAAIQYYIRYLAGIKKKLFRVRAALDKELQPARDFLESLGTAQKRLTERIPLAWKTYYFTPSTSFFSWASWVEGFGRIQLWGKTNLTMLRSLTLGNDAQGAMSVLTKIGIGLCLLFLVDFMGWRRLRHRAPQLLRAEQLRRVWRQVAMAGVLYWVSQGAPLLLHELLNGLSEILMAAALSVFSWFLAHTTGMVDASRVRNPLRWLWRLFALGLLLQIVDIPEPAMTAIWLVLLSGFFLITRRRAGTDPGVLRIPGRLTPVLIVVLAIMTVLGWQHFSVLLLAGWFLFLAALQTGSGLSQLVANWQKRATSSGASILSRSIVSGLGFPLIFLSLFFLVLYWFSTELGGPGMFLTAVSFTVTVGHVSVTLGRLALILTGFFLTRSLLSAVRSLIRDLPRLQPGLDPGVRDVLETTALYVFWGGYALISLFLLGFSFTSLAVVAGGLSVGIGFGLQNIVNNFVAGLILLFGRSIQAGDTIQIDTIWGEVRKVNIRNTMVQTFDNATLFIPNSDLIAGKLVNWTHRDRSIRREIGVGVAYGSDTELVRDILLEEAKAHPHVMVYPAPFVQFLNFGDNSLDFKLFFWVDDVSISLGTMSDIRFALDRRFRASNISIPFPQRDVHIVTDDVPPAPGTGKAPA